MQLFQKLTTFLLLVFFLSFPTVVKASGEFDTVFLATYTVDNVGTTQVSQTVTLTNKESDVFATQYALEIGSTRIVNIKAFSKSGTSIPTNTTKTDNSTVITVTFPDQVVGKGKAQQFTINYQNPDVSSLNGHVLEVSIPKLQSANSMTEYQVNLIVPRQFGEATTILPANFSKQDLGDSSQFSFSKESLSDQGVTAIFGTTQYFDFTLTYHLQNPTTNQGVTQIALPPDTSTQRLFYNQLVPKPERVNTDADNNWLATYLIPPQGKLDVTAIGQVALYHQPQVPVPKTFDVNAYLKLDEYWPTNDPKIIELAKSLGTPKNIYDYVVKNLNYNYSRLDSTNTTRYGATKALENKNDAICQEFTDVFITLARAAGIPAREHNGFAYTQNPKLRPLGLVEDILHAWPEYYDSTTNTWHQVDPTWGNTTGGIDYFNTLDLNHITFVIHGVSSTLPYPAGYYKYPDTRSKDIQISVSKTAPVINEDITTKASFWPTILMGLPSRATVTITNNSPHAIYNLPVSFAGQNYYFNQNQININQILPFSSNIAHVQLQAQTLLNQQPIKVTTITNQHGYTNDYYPVKDQATTKIASISLAAGSIFLATAAGCLLVWGLIRKNSIRRQS